MKNIFRSISIALAIVAVSQIPAATITHTVVASLSTTQGDSLEDKLAHGDTLVLKGASSLKTIGNGLLLEKNNLTVILDADADRDGTGTLASGFSLTSTGANTKVRVLMGKKSVGSNAASPAVPYASSSYPYMSVGTTGYPYIFNIGATGQLEGLYLINSRTDMEEVRDALAKRLDPGYYANQGSSPTRFGYALGQDIDMGSTAFKAMGGAKDTAFRAVFDGFGHALQNLNATGSLSALFAYTRYAIIRNLELANVSSTGSQFVAGLIGMSDSSTAVSNVHVTGGTIQGTSYVGGLVSMSYITTVSNCSNAASIKANETYAGGIIGFTQSGTTVLNNVVNTGNVSAAGGYAAGIVGFQGSSTVTITNARNTGPVVSPQYTGGIIGFQSSNTATLQNLYNAGPITATGNYAGGIIGLSYSPLTNATNAGTVTNTGDYTGGIIGYISSSIALTKVRNLGSVKGTTSVGGITGYLANPLSHAYNYGTVTGTSASGGLVGNAASGTVAYSLNTANITASTGAAGGILGTATSSSGSGANALVNLGAITGYTAAGGFAPAYTNYMHHMLNTGAIKAPAGKAQGLAGSCTNIMFGIVSAIIEGVTTEAVCTPHQYASTASNAYNEELAPAVTNTYTHAKAQSFATLLDFINYPSPKDSFTVNWHAPTPFTLPTPLNVFPDGQVYKKLRQDALVKDDTAALVLDSIRTYLPTYGSDWSYSCKARNGRATCAVAAKATTITQAYNVTGAETIVFEAAHASGLVVRDSLQVQYNVERKSAPKLSAAWPADTVVTEGTPVVLDLGQYFTDADGESISYTLSKTSVVYSELNGDVLTLCYDKKVGTETLTVYATDAGGRKSPVASLAVTVSTLPGVLKALPVLVLKTDSVLTLDLDDYFWDADGDVLGYTVTEPKNNDVVLKGSILQIAMISLRPDSLVITVADDDKHVLLAGLKLVNSTSTVLAVHPEQRLGLELAGNLLRLTSTESATAWLRILDLQGGLRYETTLDLAAGTNTLVLPALPLGAYRIHVRQGDNLRTLGWEKR
jgi:hypothetical protein